jgi:hypothetical protein
VVNLGSSGNEQTTIRALVNEMSRAGAAIFSPTARASQKVFAARDEQMLELRLGRRRLPILLPSERRSRRSPSLSITPGKAVTRRAPGRRSLIQPRYQNRQDTQQHNVEDHNWTGPPVGVLLDLPDQRLDEVRKYHRKEKQAQRLGGTIQKRKNTGKDKCSK